MLLRLSFFFHPFSFQINGRLSFEGIIVVFRFKMRTFVFFFVSFARKRKLGLAGTAARVALPSDPIFLSKLQRTNDKGEKKNKFDYLAQFSSAREKLSTPRPGQGCVNVKGHKYTPTSVKLMTLRQHQM